MEVRRRERFWGRGLCQDDQASRERASRSSAAVVVFPLPGRPRRRIAIRALITLRLRGDWPRGWFMLGEG